MPQRLSVILIENAYLLQSGMRALLEEFPSLQVSGIFEGVEKNLSEKVQALKPDLILVDTVNSPMDLRTFIKEMEVSNEIQVVGLVANDTPDNIRSLFRWVINIYECKYDLLESLKTILGKRIIPSESNSSPAELSDREKTILKEIVLGLTNQEVADKLFLSIHTVTTHRKNITNKLGIKTVSGLTVYALLNKLVDIHEIEHK